MSVCVWGGGMCFLPTDLVWKLAGAEWNSPRFSRNPGWLGRVGMNSERTTSPGTNQYRRVGICRVITHLPLRALNEQKQLLPNSVPTGRKQYPVTTILLLLLYISLRICPSKFQFYHNNRKKKERYLIFTHNRT